MRDTFRFLLVRRCWINPIHKALDLDLDEDAASIALRKCGIPGIERLQGANRPSRGKNEHYDTP